MSKSNIQKTLTESQFKEIKKILKTAELIVDKELEAFQGNKRKILKKKAD